MEFDIHAGKRVLYKDGNSGWLIGEVSKQPAEVNEKGVWVAIIPKEFIGKPEKEIDYVKYSEIHQIFTDTYELQDWMKENLLTKEEYVKLTQKEGFEKNLENAWFADKEYSYYPVSKFSEGWIMKQPFDYIIRSYV